MNYTPKINEDVLCYNINEDGTCTVYANHFFVCYVKDEKEAELFIENWEN